MLAVSTNDTTSFNWWPTNSCSRVSGLNAIARKQFSACAARLDSTSILFQPRTIKIARCRRARLSPVFLLPHSRFCPGYKYRRRYFHELASN
ncbi:hypothetical protein PF001_g569 [Phytophthora fragariae]|uniref:Uncharacterized protein n=1 Tax=Phytophthora fragariae TaxID=53985 RepID=A0A6A4EQJ5_9STRA|nr:hypothetical protein PF001_g569 [Phytophthora fragariae]